MNPDTNQFYESEFPQHSSHIPFAIGEEFTIKGHVFKVVHIDIPKFNQKSKEHLLVLTPVRKEE
jgi:hypothetical protein